MTTITSHIADTICALESLYHEVIERAADVLRKARERGALVLVCGNGGSMATASHFACDLQAVGVRAVALDSAPTITARANDYGYERSFAEQVKALQEPGGVTVVLSCSGTSKNIVEVLKAASDGENETIAFFGGSFQAELTQRELLCDSVYFVASTDYEVIEDVHLAVCHAVKKALEL